jgi:hypothetical protein
MSIHENEKSAAAVEGCDEETPGSTPTLYLIQFPDYDIHSRAATGSDSIRVHRRAPLTAPITACIPIPSVANQLRESALVLQHSDPGLNLAQLVKDVIQLRYGHTSPLLTSISSGIKTATGGKTLKYLTGWINPDILDTILVTRGQLSPDPYNIHTAHSSVSDPAQSLGRQPMSYSHQMISQSPMSHFGSPASFMTASSPATFFSARTAFNSPEYLSASGYSPATRIGTIREDEPPAPDLSAPLRQLQSDYYITLHEQNLIQPFDTELNWSGKGQHVTFAPEEPIPLTVLSNLGASNTATVDKVLCRRIALARKMMRCNRRWTVADALREVYHLQNLRHVHIVQLVGTYVQGRNLAILMYPPANCHLGTFLEDTSDVRDSDSLQYMYRVRFLASILNCLTSAVDHIHEHVTKHMDIKP